MQQSANYLNVSNAELTRIEKRNTTKTEIIERHLYCLLPVAAVLLHLLEYNFVPNAKGNTGTNIYNIFLLALLTIHMVYFIGAFFSDRIFEKAVHRTLFHTVIILLLIAYDYATLKTAALKLPYFPWVDKIFTSMIEDRATLAKSVYHTMILLFTGYFGGVIVGLVCGIGAGWSDKVSYWVQPIAKVLGSIPTTTYMPIVMMLATSMFGGSAFIIGLGVWFPVTTSTINAVTSISKHYTEAAETLGTKKSGILWRVIIPGAMPGIFTGLTQGMSVACLTVVAAEMMGVEAGLGWYINWQKGWAAFDKMYGAILLICITFILVNAVLNAIQKHVLRWQKGGV